MKPRKKDIVTQRDGTFYVCRDTGSRRLYMSDAPFIATNSPDETIYVPSMGQYVDRLDDGAFGLIDCHDIPEGCMAEVEVKISMVVYDKDGNYVNKNILKCI